MTSSSSWIFDNGAADIEAAWTAMDQTYGSNLATGTPLTWIDNALGTGAAVWPVPAGWSIAAEPINQPAHVTGFYGLGGFFESERLARLQSESLARFGSERVAFLDRIHWLFCVGLGGVFRSEYASWHRPGCTCCWGRARTVMAPAGQFWVGTNSPMPNSAPGPLTEP